MYLSVCLPLRLFVRLFSCLLACLFVCFCVLTCLSVNLLICFCLVTHTSVYPCTHLCTYHFASSLPLISLSLFVSLIACSFVRWSGRPSVCLSVCLPACMSVCLSVSVPPFARSLSRSSLSFILVGLPFQAVWRLCFYVSVLPTAPSNGHRLKHMAWMVSTFPCSKKSFGGLGASSSDQFLDAWSVNVVVLHEAY